MPRPDHCKHCGAVFDDALPRAPTQHRAYFAMIKMAMNGWPEAYEYQPRGLTLRQKFEDLRAWLICKSGWRICVLKFSKHATPAPDMLRAHYATLMEISRAVPTFPAEDESYIYFVQPKSIRFEECSQEDFRPIFDETMFIIEQITGIKVEFIKKELRKFQ